MPLHQQEHTQHAQQMQDNLATQGLLRAAAGAASLGRLSCIVARCACKPTDHLTLFFFLFCFFMCNIHSGTSLPASAARRATLRNLGASDSVKNVIASPA